MEPHQQRVVDEKAELDERLAKLRAFTGASLEFAELPEAERARLRLQQRLMTQLSDVLAERLEAMGT